MEGINLITSHRNTVPANKFFKF